MQLYISGMSLSRTTKSGLLCFLLLTFFLTDMVAVPTVKVFTLLFSHSIKNRQKYILTHNTQNQSTDLLVCIKVH